MGAVLQIPISTLDLCECRRPAIGRCAWLMEKPTPISVAELRTGDILVHPRHGRRMEVTSIEQALTSSGVPYEGLLRVAARKCANGRAPLLKGYLWRVEGTILAVRSGPCNESVCERHAREVAEGRVYCAAHWNAWRDVA